MRLMYFVLILFVVNTFCYSQNSTYKIIISKGDVTFSEEGKKWQRINTGMSFNNDIIIKTTGKHLLVIVDNKGHNKEIKSDGVYSLAELFNSIKGGKSSELLKKFGDYITEQIMNSGKKQSTLPGTVFRSTDIISNVTPNNTFFINDKVKLSWNKFNNESEYYIVITDTFDEKIYTKSISDTFLTINNDEVNLSPGNTYFWTVFVDNNRSLKSDEFYFKIHSKEISEEIINTKADLLLENPDMEDEIYGNIILAKFYEENKMYSDAIDTYIKIINKEPEIEELKNLYYEFLNKIYNWGG